LTSADSACQSADSWAGELEVIGALISGVAQGRGGVLVREGPPSIGKSRMLTARQLLSQRPPTQGEWSSPDELIHPGDLWV
jgi:hypothetical protein